MSLLFHEVIFGPVKSRRLGTSLGINLLPVNGKICSFDCIYCECGFNEQGIGTGFSGRQDINRSLSLKLRDMKQNGEPLDSITFAGNGEPTVHPEFPELVEDVVTLRDTYFPNAKVSVLTNSVHLNKESVFEALKKIDNCILKLDSAVQETFMLINQPENKQLKVCKVIDRLVCFDGKKIIQTMFLKGSYNGREIDNTTDTEVDALIDAMKRIKPDSIMIYSLDRPTPASQLEKINKNKMETIASKFRAAGFEVSVSA